MNTKKTLEAFIKQSVNKNGQPGSSKYILQLQKSFRKYFKIQQEDYLSNLKEEMDFTNAILKTETGNNTDEARDELLKIYELTLSETVLKGSLNLLKNLEISSNFGIQDLIALEFARKRAGDMIVGIDKTTHTQINGIISQGIKDGNDYTAIAKAIKNRFKNFSKYRATLIATNEIGTAYEYGKIEQAKEYSSRTGNQMMKRSITQGDSKVSSICKECAGQGWIKAEELFASGKETSPNHISCRCYVQYKTASNI